MGGAVSTNAINDGVKVMTQTINSSTQDCIYNVSQNEASEIKVSGGSTVNVGDIDFSELASVDTQCLSSSSTQTTAQQNVSETATQLAQATVGAFGIGISDANNVQNLWTQIGDDVVNAYTQVCADNFTTTEVSKIKASGGSTVNVGVINYSEQFNSLQDCVQQNVTSTSSSQMLQQILEQSAKSEVEGILGPLIFLVVIILVIVGAVVFGGTKALTSKKFWITVIIIVLVYFILAFVFKWWPFHKTDDSTNNSM